VNKNISLIMAVSVSALFFLPIVSVGSEESIIDVELQTGIFGPTVKIENLGNEMITNVRITDVNIEGNVLYNNRETFVTGGLSPGGKFISQPDSMFIGFGVFTISVTVECDQSNYTTDEMNGFILGWLVYIP